MNRRHLLKTLSVLPVVTVIPQLGLAKADPKKAMMDKAKGKAEEAKAKVKGKAEKALKKAKGKVEAPKNLLSENEGLGKAMQYKNDATKAGPIRANKKSICHNCAKWNLCNATDKACKPQDKDGAFAPCNVFAGKVVAKGGWCLSWQAKS